MTVELVELVLEGREPLTQPTDELAGTMDIPNEKMDNLLKCWGNLVMLQSILSSPGMEQ